MLFLFFVFLIVLFVPSARSLPEDLQPASDTGIQQGTRHHKQPIRGGGSPGFSLAWWDGVRQGDPGSTRKQPRRAGVEEVQQEKGDKYTEA